MTPQEKFEKFCHDTEVGGAFLAMGLFFTVFIVGILCSKYIYAIL